MEVLIQIQKGSDVSKLEVRGASQESEKAIITGFFNSLGVSEFEEDAKKKVDFKSPKVTEAKTRKPKAEHVQGITKKLPKVGAENRSSFPVEDIAKVLTEKDERPDHWDTGIKEGADGVRRYKCRYFCDCGNQGNHYIPLNLRLGYVKCHECGQHLDVDAATLEDDVNGVPVRDDFGNFFVAR